MTITVETRDAATGDYKEYTILEAERIRITSTHGLIGKPITEWNEQGFEFEDNAEVGDD